MRPCPSAHPGFNVPVSAPSPAAVVQAGARFPATRRFALRVVAPFASTAAVVGLSVAGLGMVTANALAQAPAAGASAASAAAVAGVPTPMPHGAIVLTPRAGPAPRINGTRVLGVLPGSTVRFQVPATGDRPMRFSAGMLPAGLTIDSANGWITGACAQPGEYPVTLQAVNAAGRDEKPLRVVVGEVTALTPPMTWSDPAGGNEVDADRRAAALAASPLGQHGWSSGTAAPPAEAAEDSWRSMATSGFIRSRETAPGGPGRWRELGPLLLGWIGPSGARRPTRLTPDEQSTQISLWCLLAAPLRLDCDLARLDAFTLSLLTNDEVLALDQDALGRPAALIARDDAVQTWARPLADGSIVVGFFNLGQDPAAGNLQWAELDLTGPQIVRDLWRQRDLGAYTDRFDAPVTPHGVFLFRLRPAP